MTKDTPNAPEMRGQISIHDLLDGIGEALVAALYALEDSEVFGRDDFAKVPLQQVDRLNSALDTLEGWPDEPGCTCGPAASAQWAIKCALAAKDAQIERLREALEWYAAQVAGCRLVHSDGDKHRHALSNDGGKRARVALGEG